MKLCNLKKGSKLLYFWNPEIVSKIDLVREYNSKFLEDTKIL